MNARRAYISLAVGAPILFGAAAAHVGAVRELTGTIRNLHGVIESSPSEGDKATTREQIACVRGRVETAFRHDIPGLLARLTAILNSLDASDRVITTDTVRQRGAYRSTSVTVSFKGSVRTVFDLMRELCDDSGYPVRVERLDIARSPSAPADRLSVAIEITVFTRGSP